MNSVLTSEALAELQSGQTSPCLSVYLKTHRLAPENQQDPIRFRNLLKDLESSLLKQHPQAETRTLLEPFEALAQDRGFWNHAQDGLAVLGAAGLFRVFRLQQPVQELAVVAESFHTKPLRRFLQSTDRYQLLGLSLSKVRLFEGNRHTLDEIVPAEGVPRSLTDARAALGAEPTEPHQTVASYGGAAGASPAMHHGHGGKKDGMDNDRERFFRALDRAVLDHHSRPSGLPLMLVALAEHHHLFREISHNPFLMAEGLSTNPDALSVEELRLRALVVIESRQQARLTVLSDEFGGARAKGLGGDDLAQVALAAVAGRIATLLIEADREIPGRLDRDTGQIDEAELSDPRADDLLDDLAELVTKRGGDVKVLEAAQMPTRTGVAAFYRY